MLSGGLLRKWLTMKITAQNKVAVILNITPPEAEKQVLGFKVSEINLSLTPLTTTGQYQLRFIQSKIFQPLCIIEIRETIQRFQFGII